MTRFGNTYLLIALFSGFFVLGCQKTAQDILSLTNSDKEAIHFKLQIPGLGEPTTYSMDGSPESEVKNITLLLFHQQANGSHYTFEKAITIQQVNNTNTGSQYQAEFKADLDLTYPKDKYCVSIVANASPSLQSLMLNITKGTDKATVMEQLIESKSTKWETDAKNYTPIPMYCEIQPKIFANGETLSGYVFMRMLARIDVICNDPNAQIVNIILANHASSGTIASKHDSNGLKIINNNDINLPKGFQLTRSSDLNYPISGSSTGDIYTFESPAANAQTNIADATCLLLQLSYNNTLSWYRVDFVSTGQNPSFMPLLRNHKYSVNINKVLGTGYTDMKEALMAKGMPNNLKYDILTYNLQDNIKSFVYNGQYYLGTDIDSLIFPKSADTKTVYFNTNYNTTNSTTYTINEIGGMKTIPSWAHIIAQGTNGLSVTVDLNNANTARQGVLTINAGRLTKQIHIIQEGAPTQNVKMQGESNCYIVETQNEIGIPVSRANNIPELGTQINNGERLTAELVWTDNSNGMNAHSNISAISIDGNGPTARLIVHTGTEEGNAVVAVKNSANQILWSWHIWVCNPGNTPKQIDNFMDRNLGAFSIDVNNPKCFGLFYQWGRKDPFPGLDINGNIGRVYNQTGQIGTANTTKMPIESTLSKPISWNTPPSENLSATIRNPATFYLGVDPLHDWFTNSMNLDQGSAKYKNADLWGFSSKVKTKYDPCPEGYKIPDNTYSSFISSNLHHINNIIYVQRTNNNSFPAAGYYENGKIIPHIGGYWINKTDAPKADGLRFEHNNLEPAHPFPTSNGCSVRCIVDPKP